MRVITVSHCGKVEAVLVFNEDEVKDAVDQIRVANEENDLDILVHEPDSLADVVNYAKGW